MKKNINTDDKKKLERIINSLFDAMKKDYEQKFSERFNNSESIRQYKRRLWVAIIDKNSDDIIDGYELFTDSSSEWPPTIPELIKNIDLAKKNRMNLIKNRAEPDQIANSETPKIECNPLKMLENAINSVTNSDENMDEWMDRKLEKLRILNSELHAARYKIKKISPLQDHLCSAAGCGIIGTMSAGTMGGGNFYCRDHFRFVR